MKVRLNVKIIPTQAAFDKYKTEQNFNKLTIQYPVLIASEDSFITDLNDVTCQLEWVQDRKGILLGPSLTWLMVFPNSHLYYVNSKFGYSFLPLPYDWLGFDIENDGIKENSFILKVLENSIVPFYERYSIKYLSPHRKMRTEYFPQVVPNTSTKYWQKKIISFEKGSNKEKIFIKVVKCV